jgi:HPr kinase/phosphorylase
MNNDPENLFSVKVGELLEPPAKRLKLKFITGKKGLSKEITVPRIQKPGLALSGFFNYLHSHRIQILGKSELSFLRSQSRAKQKEIIENICLHHITCFIITKNRKPPIELEEQARKKGIPLMQTSLPTADFIDKITLYLGDRFAPSHVIHGALLEIYGLGTLIIGESGIGKSECALELIAKGHRLVSDDVVEIKRTDKDALIGSGPELIRHHMEIRGLGVINIKDLFGVAFITDAKEIALVIKLERWSESEEYDRIGLEEHTYNILDVEVPLIRMPVAPGRNISMLVEIASRHFALKRRGYQSARDFVKTVRKKIRLSDLANREEGSGS